MSRSIDNKVVSMEFDNSKFESNVKTSISTIDKLKQSLKFDDVPKGFEKIEAESKKVSMSGLSGAVEEVKMRFSALEVMAVTALANITNSAIETGKRLVSSLTVDQIAAGWDKYEKKTSNVQTIMNATGKSIDEVNNYLNKLMWFSDETSYGFTDMTAALATMTSSGGDIDKLIPMIEGVANAVAFAGKGAAEFSRVMQYSINQAYSLGYMQVQDWKTIEGATANSKQLMQTLIAAGEQLGTIEKGTVTLESFRSSLKDAWLTSEVMEAGFGRFAEFTEAVYSAVESGKYRNVTEAINAMADSFDELSVKAFNSGREYKSFTDAVEATKDAVSSGWLQTFETIFGNYEEAKKLWTDVGDTMLEVFGSGAEVRNQALQEAFNSKWPDFTEQIKEAGVPLDDFKNKLDEVVRFHGKSLELMIQQEGSLQAVFEKGLIPKNVIAETLEGLSKMEGAHEDLNKKLEEFQNLTKRIWNGEFGNGAERMKKLAEAGYDYAEVQDLVNKTVGGYELTLEDLNEAQLESIGYTTDEIKAIKELARQARFAEGPFSDLIDSMTKPSGRELFTDAISKGLETLKTSISVVKTAWTEIFGELTGDKIYSALEGINNFATKSLSYVQNNFDKFKDAFKGLFAALDIVKMFVGDVVLATIKKVLYILGYANNDILTCAQSIGQLIVKIRDWLKEHKVLTSWYGVFLNYVTEAIKKVYDWIKAFANLPNVQKALSSISSVMKDLSFSGVKSFFNGGLEKVKNFFTTLKNMDKISFKNIGSALKTLIQDLTSYFTNLDNLSPELKKGLKTMTNGLEPLINDFKNKLSNFKNKMSPILEWLKDKFPKDLKISVGNILAIGLGVALIRLMGGLTKTLGKIDDVIKVFSNIAGAVSKFIKSINKVIGGLAGIEKAYAKKLKAESFQMIAEGILMIAASIAMLSMLDTKKMVIAAAVLAGVMGIMVLLTKKVGTMESKFDFKMTAGTILALATSILILAIAFKSLSKIDPDGLEIAIVGLLACVLAMAMLIKACGLFGKDATVKVFTVIGLAIGVKILADTLKTISDLNPDQLKNGLIGMLGCVIAMGLVLAACKGVKAKNLFGPMVAAIGILALGLSMKAIASLETETIIMSLFNMLQILLILIPIFLVTRLAGKEAIKAGGSILAISVALITISLAMKIIATMDPNEVTRATLAILGIMAMLSLIIIALGVMTKLAGAKGKVNSAALTIAAMGLAIVAIAAAIMMLALLNDDQIKRGLLVVTSILGMFALLIAASGLSKDCYKTLIGIGVLVGILAVTVGAISMIKDREGVEAATKVIIAIMGMLSVVIASTKFAQKAMGTIIALGVVVAGLVALIGFLNKSNMAPSLDTLIGMSILIVSLSASLALLGHIKGIEPKTLAKITLSVGLLGGLVAVIGGLVGVLGKMDIEPSIQTAAALSILVVALSGACILLGLAGKFGSAAFVGIGVFAALIGAIGVILAAFSGIDALMGEANLGEFLSNGIPALEAIGEGLGRFLGSITNGLLNGLAGTGSELSSFMENMKGFLEGCKDITPEVGDGIKSLAAGLVALTGAELLNGLGRIIGGKGASLKDLGKQLKDIAPFIKDFADEMKDVDTKALQVGCNTIKMLSDAASNLGRHDGKWQKIIGDNKISDFIKMLADCFTSENGSFREYVLGLKSVSGDWAGIKSNTEEFIGVLETISEFSNTLARHGGFLQIAQGDNTISDFVGMLCECLYGTEGEGSFQKYTSGLDGVSGSWETIKSNTESFLEILEMVSTFADTLSTHGGIKTWFQGDNTLAKFIDDMSAAIFKFNGFAENMKTVEEAVGFKVTKERVELMADAMNSMSSVMTLFNENSASTFKNKPMTKFTDDLSGAGVNLKTFVSNMEGITGSNLSSIAYGLKQLVESVTGISEEGNARIVEFTDNLLRLGQDAITTFVNAMNDNPEVLEKAGSELTDACLRGVSSKTQEVMDAGQNVADTFYNHLNTTSNINNMYTTGQNFVQGFINGINSKKAAAESAAYNLGKATNSSLQSATQIHSPSRITTKFGQYFVQGFVNGIKNSVRNAVRASENLGNESINSLSNTFQRISEIISSDVDTQPIIRPVLDLSDVETGASKINGLMGKLQPVGKINPSASLAFATNTGLVESANGTGNIEMNITIYGAEGQDVNELANIVSQKINMGLNRRTNVWK